MGWLPRLIIKFGALSLLSLGACGNTGAPTYSAARSEPDSTDEPPFENGLPDVVKWLKSGNTMYWIDNEACVEWFPSTVRNKPYRVMLRHEVRHLSRDLFIRKALLTFEFGGVAIDGDSSEKHWVLQQGPGGPTWDLRGTTNTARTLVMQVAVVDNGRAVAVAGNTWWWFARPEDCQRDVDFPPIHGFSVQPPLPKVSVPWPRDPRRAKQSSE